MNNAPARHFKIIFCTFSVFAYLYAKNNPTPPIMVDITIYRICSNPKSCGATITSKIEKFFFFFCDKWYYITPTEKFKHKQPK